MTLCRRLVWEHRVRRKFANRSLFSLKWNCKTNLWMTRGRLLPLKVEISTVKPSRSTLQLSTTCFLASTWTQMSQISTKLRPRLKGSQLSNRTTNTEGRTARSKTRSLTILTGKRNVSLRSIAKRGRRYKIKSTKLSIRLGAVSNFLARVQPIFTLRRL